MLSLDSVDCIRGGKALFGGLSLSILPGSFMELKGANGSGKTSLLEIMAGLKSPQKGSVLWDNTNIKTMWEDYRASVLYIAHEHAMKNELTVLQNLEFWAALDEAEMLVPAAIEGFDLGGFVNVEFGMLSAGQKKRVSISRIFINLRPIWFLDEPFTNLDTETSDIVKNAIVTKVSRGGLITIAIHGESGIKGGLNLDMDDFSSIPEKDEAWG